jgi:hypothetical protein
MCVCVTPLSCVAVLQPRSAAAGGKSREDTINEIVDSIKTRLPGEYDVEAVSMQYPVKYEDSMNTVLVQVRQQLSLKKNSGTTHECISLQPGVGHR